MNKNDLWQSVLGELELSLSKANFTTWFKNTFIFTFEGEKIVIGVPNLFTKAWLEKKYHKDIFKSLQNLSNNEIRSVVYSVETKKEEEDPGREELSLHSPGWLSHQFLRAGRKMDSRDTASRISPKTAIQDVCLDASLSPALSAF